MYRSEITGRPAGEQGRFPETRRSADQQQAASGRQRPGQRLAQAGTLDLPGGRLRDVHLGVQQEVVHASARLSPYGVP